MWTTIILVKLTKLWFRCNNDWVRWTNESIGSTMKLVENIKLFVDLTYIMVVHIMNNQTGCFNQFDIREYLLQMHRFRYQVSVLRHQQFRYHNWHKASTAIGAYGSALFSVVSERVSVTDCAKNTVFTCKHCKIICNLANFWISTYQYRIGI